MSALDKREEDIKNALSAADRAKEDAEKASPLLLAWVCHRHTVPDQNCRREVCTRTAIFQAIGNRAGHVCGLKQEKAYTSSAFESPTGARGVMI